MTLEDETGVANIIIWRKVFDEFRRVVLGARLVAVTGWVQREGIVIHVIAEKIADMSHLLAELSDGETLDPVSPRADEVKRPGQDTRENTRTTLSRGPHKAAPPKISPPRMPGSRDFR